MPSASVVRILVSVMEAIPTSATQPQIVLLSVALLCWLEQKAAQSPVVQACLGKAAQRQVASEILNILEVRLVAEEEVRPGRAVMEKREVSALRVRTLAAAEAVVERAAA